MESSMADPSFTGRELDVMSVLWEHGPSTVALVREQILDRLGKRKGGRGRGRQRQ
jgi:predicted transcriptional regulator